MFFLLCNLLNIQLLVSKKLEQDPMRTTLEAIIRTESGVVPAFLTNHVSIWIDKSTLTYSDDIGFSFST